MELADGSIKKGLFENNTFIEEITEEDENLESSLLDLEPKTTTNDLTENSQFKVKNTKKVTKKNKKKIILPNIDTNPGYGDQSGRIYMSALKPKKRDLSVIARRKNSKKSSLSARKKGSYSSQPRLIKSKNTISLPNIGARNIDSAVSDRIQGFTGIAKTQAAERKKLESYFKSLDKAVQILRNKRQNELANRPWVPAGPIRSMQYRPSSKYG